MRKLYLLLVLLALGVPAVADESHHHEITAEQLGTVSFPISCSAASQKQFERGVAWLHSFEYEHSAQDFQAVEKSEPNCAMAYWGEAMSLYHQLWEHPPKEDVARGAMLLKKAASLKPKSSRERDYISALTIFYSADDQQHYTKRVEKYSAAMEKLSKKNPNDREAAIFYALSLLALGDDKDPALTHKREAVSILNAQLRSAPDHPGITHYIIHATDNPQLASMGLEAARAYARIAPASAHAIHMPSHIFTRLGLWQESIQSNLAAIAVADQMAGFHTAHHKLHSMDFLLYAYLQTGDDRKAKAIVDGLSGFPKDSFTAAFLDYYQAAAVRFPSTYMLERRQWKDALSIAPDPASPPYTQAIAHWTHAVAAGHLKDAATARTATEQLLRAIEATKNSSKAYLADDLDTPREEAMAWQRHAEGKDEEAIRLLRAAADKQDKVGKGETEMPAREMLADLLLDSGHATEALQEFETSLKVDPNRFNGLYGAAQAAEKVGQSEKANTYFAQLLKNCSGVDSDREELIRAKTVAEVK